MKKIVVLLALCVFSIAGVQNAQAIDNKDFEKKDMPRYEHRHEYKNDKEFKKHQKQIKKDREQWEKQKKKNWEKEKKNWEKNHKDWKKDNNKQWKNKKHNWDKNKHSYQGQHRAQYENEKRRGHGVYRGNDKMKHNPRKQYEKVPSKPVKYPHHK